MKNTVEDFWKQVDKSEDCWMWVGKTTEKGYGRFNFAGKEHFVHRLAYSFEHGEMPKWPIVLDHLCRSRACVRASHLEAVTVQENIRRGKNVALRHLRKPRSRPTHCMRGHEFTEATIQWSIKDKTTMFRSQRCKICDKWKRDLRNSKLKERRKAR